LAIVGDSELPMGTPSAQLVTQNSNVRGPPTNTSEQPEAVSKCAVTTPHITLQAHYDVILRSKETGKTL